MQRSGGKIFNDCGLSTSLYSTCYPESLSENAERRAASNASMRSSLDVVFHSHHSEYGGMGRLMPQDARRSSSSGGVRFYIGEAADEDLDVAVDAAATLASESSDSLSLFEEEVHIGLQRVLNHSIKRQIHTLFSANFGMSTSVAGLEEVLPSLIEDLLHLSEVEPYGVKGANLIVLLGKPLPRSGRKSSVNSNNSSSSVSSGYDDAAGAHQANDPAEEVTVLGSAKLCAETVTTFDLILTLRESKTQFQQFKNWMAANVFKAKQSIMLDSKFTLRKRMLYR